jgi:membrane associated rhomboid family serine protease
MGIYDREYYREDSGGFWGAISGHRTTWGIIAVTVGVWLMQLFSARDEPYFFTEWFAFHRDAVLHGQVWRLFTCHFVHHPIQDFVAVGVGMLCFYFVGRPLEDIYGPREFLGFYLAAGLVAALGDLFVGFAVRNPDHVAYGASAVLTAVLVLFACHFPQARMLIIPIPVWVVAAVIVGLNLLGAYANPKDGGPAPILLAIGFAFLYYFAQLRVWPPVQAVIDWVAALFQGRRPRRPPLRVAPEADDDEPVAAAAPAPRSSKPARTVDEQLEAKLDHVLEKVSRFGRDSLTAEERDILLRASEIYKRRRGQ